jgi:hypothetical protein
MAGAAASVASALGPRAVIAVGIGLPCAFVAIPQIRRAGEDREQTLPGDMSARYAGIVARLSVGEKPPIAHASQQTMDKLMMTNSVVQKSEKTLRATRSQAGVDRDEECDMLKRTKSLKYKRSNNLDRHGATSWSN